MSNDRLLNSLISSKPVRKGEKPEFSKAIRGEVDREFKKSKHQISKLKRNEIRRNIYEIKNRKNLFTLGSKKTEKSLDKLENFLSKTK